SDFRASSAWTSVSANVAASVVSDPFGDGGFGRLTDPGGSLAYVSQTFAQSVQEGLAAGEWCVSMFVRSVSSNATRIEVRTGSGVAVGVLYWTLGAARFETVSTIKGTVRMRATQGDWFFVTLSFWLGPDDRTTRPEVRIYPASGSAAEASSSGVIEVAKVAVNRGRYGAHIDASRALVIDQPLELDSGDPKEVSYGSLADTLETIPIDYALTPTGSYEAGDTIWLESAPVVTPREGNLFSIRGASDVLLVQIVSASLTNDLNRRFEALEYDPDVFVDVVTVDDESGSTGRGLFQDATRAPLGSSLPATSEFGTTIGQDDDRVPEPAASITITDQALAGANGPQTVMRVRWSRTADRSPGDQVRVWGRPWGATDAWDLLGTYPADSGGAEIELARGAEAEPLEVSVQLVSRHGLSRTIEGSTRTAHQFSGLGPLPAQPADVVASLVGLRAVFEWALTDAGISTMGRRGGWVLGDDAFAVRGSSTGATERWAVDPFGEGVGELQVAHVDTAGRPSLPVSVTTGGETTATSDRGDSREAPTRWEAGGWIAYVQGGLIPTDGPALLGGLTLRADGSLGFEGSTELSGQYQTDRGLTTALSARSGRLPRRLVPQAVVEASQIHPLTCDQVDLAANDPQLERWTCEGPIYLRPGEEECSLRIEMSVLLEDAPGKSWGPWVRFSPAELVAVDVRFRLVAARPSVDFDVRITQFHTAVLGAPTALDAGDEASRSLEGDFFGRL
ncbi:MAG: hypothetical protein AAFP86_05990, partial [Planctomycetota bacterium]